MRVALFSNWPGSNKFVTAVVLFTSRAPGLIIPDLEIKASAFATTINEASAALEGSITVIIFPTSRKQY